MGFSLRPSKQEGQGRSGEPTHIGEGRFKALAVGVWHDVTVAAHRTGTSPKKGTPFIEYTLLDNQRARAKLTFWLTPRSMHFLETFAVSCGFDGDPDHFEPEVLLNKSLTLLIKAYRNLEYGDVDHYQVGRPPPSKPSPGVAPGSPPAPPLPPSPPEEQGLNEFGF